MTVKMEKLAIIRIVLEQAMAAVVKVGVSFIGFILTLENGMGFKSYQDCQFQAIMEYLRDNYSQEEVAKPMKGQPPEVVVDIAVIVVSLG